MSRKSILTQAEKKAVHQATFAAAFTQDFFATLKFFEHAEHLRNYNQESAYDRAKESTGERAYAVADLAVEQYGHWNPKGGAYKLPAGCCPDCAKRKP